MLNPNPFRRHAAPIGALALAGICCLTAARPRPPQTNTSSVYVRADHLAELRSLFNSNFKAYLNGELADIQNTAIRLRWNALDSLVPDQVPSGFDDFGIRFQYGLDGSNNFQLGFEIVLLKHVDAGLEAYKNDAEKDRMYGVTPMSDQFYTITDERVSPVSKTTWLGTMQETYIRNLRIRRTDKDEELSPCNKYLDAHSEVFPWGMELERLRAQNSGDPSDNLVIGCTGDRAGWLVADGDTIGSGYQHSLCVYLDGRIGSDEVDPSTPFKMRGANLGTLCPSRCDLYVRPAELAP